MEHQVPRHERVRFRKDEIVDLGSLPSGAELIPPSPKRSAVHYLGRVVLSLGLGCVVILAAAWVALTAFGSSDFASHRLRSQVETLIGRIAGPDVKTNIGPARLALDGASLVAVDFDAVGLTRGEGEAAFLEARELSFGLRAWPLLRGRVELATASVNGAHIALEGLGGSGGDWAASIRDDRGLIDPDRITVATFEALDRFVSAVRSGSTREIRFQDVTIAASQAQSAQRVHFDTATIAEAGDAVTIEGSASFNATAFTFRGSVETGAGRSQARSLELTMETVGSSGEPNSSLNLTGQRENEKVPTWLRATITADGQELDLGRRGVLKGNIDLAALLSSGSSKAEIERLNFEIGQSRLAFTGAVGPTPRDAPAAAQPAYRFELVSTESLIAPEDSPEAALPASLKLAGSYAGDRLDVNEIGIRTSSGEALGRGSLQFAAGRSPGISLDMGVNGMSVQQAKQLWPWLAAGGARRWVMNNFFGGTVREGGVRYQVAVGRLELTEPLDANEVSGRFVVSDSRFDIAGLLPPVRDAEGEVVFGGRAVDIKLTSGTAYMASGRSVMAKDGVMLIRNVGVSPLIGKLDIDISGSADAVAELASYEPIAVMRQVGLQADDFSGDVEGHVRADIPLQRGIDRKKLDWLVDLTYSKLNLRKALDGQVLTEADGTISIDPRQAVIKATGRLNGIPAELDVVRPLGGSDAARRQKVELVYDDKLRAELAPGLNTLLSGPITLKVDASAGEGRRKVEADLTSAKLELPWIGWSKGAGIAAKATFDMVSEGGVSRISNFQLDGKSFSARGSLTTTGGSLQSAQFDRVSLNGDDDFAVTLTRPGKGYAIDVRGSTFDARSLIKGINTRSAAKRGSGASVAVSARLQKLIGFGNETLRDVTLKYSGTGSTVGSLKLNGVSRSGTAVSIENTTSGKTQTVAVSAKDAGAFLRFLNIYERAQGGSLSLSLSGQETLHGRLDLRNFVIVDEPRLGSLVSSRPPGGDRSLSQATNAVIDTSRVTFDHGYADLERGDGTLKIANGVLRGPLIGTTFQGTVYDQANRMNMTGTFMPAYGLNSMFGDIPLLGALLGNGRDRGLIGITYRLRGDAKAPQLEVNPLSVIAPGIFRSIFEF